MPFPIVLGSGTHLFESVDGTKPLKLVTHKRWIALR
jgi:hypothetical protein